MPIKLTQSNLGSLSEKVSVPSYSRENLTAGILHIGLGNFHRAHQAVYLDDLFNRGEGHDWAIVGAGIRPNDAAMREKLMAQDWLSTVIELDPKGLTARINGSMIDFVEVNPSSLIDEMSKPNIRIVSLTITEGGYYIDARSGGFDKTHPDIQADIANPAQPETVFGMLIQALLRRREAGLGPFTIMSCDNLPENGHVAKQTVVGLAHEISTDIGNWISDNVAFPNSMVDCITPATTDRERKIASQEFGIDDVMPVACEPFRQWVLEDNFSDGRPALEYVGVQFVDDVAPYELMKLRMLNGGHAAIAYPAALLGLDYAHEAMAHPLVSGFLNKLENDEIIPTLKPSADRDTESYLALLEDRFANSAVGDTIARLCLDGSNRQPKFILPTIIERLESGLAVDGLALEVALWCRYCAGNDDAGNSIFLDDNRAEQLKKSAVAARHSPNVFLDMEDIFGDLGKNELFRAKFGAALTSLYEKGTAATLASYIEDGEQRSL